MACTGHGGEALVSWLISGKDDCESGRIKPAVQLALDRGDERLEVPTARELVETGEAKEAIDFIASALQEGFAWDRRRPDLPIATRRGLSQRTPRSGGDVIPSAARQRIRHRNLRAGLERSSVRPTRTEWICAMFRLTAVLLAGLYATMVIWGEAPDSDVAVTRADSMSPAVAGLGAAPVAAQDRSSGPDDLSALTEREAVEVALEAAGTPTEPVEAPAAAPAASEEEPDADLWYVTGARVNLRSGPSSSAAIIGGVSLGDRAELLSDPEASWIRIRTERGLEAWIFGRYLSETPA